MPFSAGQYREQAQKQNLIQRVGHRPRLARIRQILEMIKENNRFTQRTHTIHPTPPLSESKTPIDSATNRFVTAFFTPLPAGEIAAFLTAVKGARHIPSKVSGAGDNLLHSLKRLGV